MFKFVERHSKKKELKKELRKALEKHAAARNFVVTISDKDFKDGWKERSCVDDEIFEKVRQAAFTFGLDWMDETIDEALSIEKEIANL